MLVDLHTHTSASDGELAPLALLQMQADAGVGLTAFTDHDTLDGWDRIAAMAVPAVGLPRLLPGVEFSVDAAGREIHVVGLGFDPAHPAIREGVAAQQLRRRARAERIAARLEYLGVHGALAGAELEAAGAGLGRPHFARFLVASGRVRTLDEAFHRYLGRGKPAACRMEWPAMDEATGWIRAAGGLEPAGADTGAAGGPRSGLGGLDLILRRAAITLAAPAVKATPWRARLLNTEAPL